MSIQESSVSVVIPAYNCAGFIREAIESVLAQDYGNRELVVVDDGSTDATSEVVRSFGSAVRLIGQSNRGPAAARNRGLAEARGDYVAFLDGDDVWLPGKLAEQMSYFRTHPETGVVFSGFGIWQPRHDGSYPPASEWEANGVRDVIGPAYDGYLYPDLLLDSVLCIITAVVSRNVFASVGAFDESLRVGEDYDFWIRASRQFQAHKVDRVYALYRMRPQSATRSAPRTVSSEYFVVRRAIERFGVAGPNGREVSGSRLRERLATLSFDHGYRHFWSGDLRVAGESFRQSLRHAWWSPRTLAYALAAQARLLLSAPRRPGP